MLKPRCISEAEAKLTEELKTIRSRSSVALFDDTLTDDAADAIIMASNAILTDAGMPAGGLTVTRAAFRALSK